MKELTSLRPEQRRFRGLHPLELPTANRAVATPRSAKTAFPVEERPFQPMRATKKIPNKPICHACFKKDAQNDIAEFARFNQWPGLPAIDGRGSVMGADRRGPHGVWELIGKRVKNSAFLP